MAYSEHALNSLWGWGWERLGRPGRWKDKFPQGRCCVKGVGPECKGTQDPWPEDRFSEPICPSPGITASDRGSQTPLAEAQAVGSRDPILGMLRSPWASRLPRESWGISSHTEREGSRTKCFCLSRALPVPASPLSWPESQLHRAPCRWTLIPRCCRNIKTSSSLSCKQLTAPLWLLHVLGLPTAQFPGLVLWQSQATLWVSANATECLAAPPCPERVSWVLPAMWHSLVLWKPLKCRIWGWDLVLGKALSLSKAWLPQLYVGE